MPAATIPDTNTSGWPTTGATARTTGSVSWVAGDRVYVGGLTEDDAKPFTGVPTTAGTNLGAFTQVVTTSTGSTCKATFWVAVATGTGSGTITANATNAGDMAGLRVWVIRGSTGQGNSGSAASGSTLTVSVIRSGTNSIVLVLVGDFNATNDTVVGWTPAGITASDDAAWVSGRATLFSAHSGDEGAAGTTSYGIGSGFSTPGPVTRLALEILGTAAGAGNPLPPFVVPRPAVVRAATW